MTEKSGKSQCLNGHVRKSGLKNRTLIISSSFQCQILVNADSYVYSPKVESFIVFIFINCSSNKHYISLLTYLNDLN